LLEDEKETVYEMAKTHPNMNHRKLAYWMQNEGICYVSPSSVYRLLKARGLIKERDMDDRQAPDSRDDGPDGPNQQWHTDITYVKVNGRWAKLVSFLDGYSRKIVQSKLSFSLSAHHVSRVYDEALKNEGLLEANDKPKVVSDNGPRFVGRGFTGLLDELGVQHRTIPVNHPESNGKIEVYHKTLKYERVYLQGEYESLVEAREDIEEFVTFYNTTRLHQGIDYVTPNQKHNGKAEAIIEERNQNHQEAIERRKRINQERSEPGKTKEEIRESV
jgi:transposase InsO family protein